MIRLSAKQKEKILNVTTEHDYEGRYMVVLKEGWVNKKYPDNQVAFFNTTIDVRIFIDEAEFVEN